MSDYNEVEVIQKRKLLQDILEESHGTESKVIAEKIINLLVSCGIALPSIEHNGIKKLANVLQSNQSIVIASPFCPDYSYTTTNNPNKPYKFTFECLNNGIGVVAEKALSTSNIFYKNLTNLNIKHTFLFAICDYEGLNPLTLKKINLAQNEFMEKCRQSLEMFNRHLQIPVNMYRSSLITHLTQEDWQETFNKEAARIIENTPDSPKHSISSIYDIAVHEGFPLYKTWFSLLEDLSDSYEIALELVKMDAINFLSVALVFSKVCNDQPLIILSCDRPSMAFFYELVGKVHKHPVCVLHLQKGLY